MAKLRRHHRPWTQEEDEFLSKHNGYKSYNWIAARLHRTPTAVEGRINTLGIKDRHAETNTFSAREVAYVLGKSHETIRRWIREHGLKAEKRNNGYEGIKHTHYYISPEDVWDFVESHKDWIDFTKVQRGVLLPEPEWLREEILKAYDGKVNKKGRLWSDEEKNELWRLHISGKSMKEISVILGRPYKGVEKQLTKIIKSKIG